MGKIAVVGCEASGKTVFMAALSDYFKVGQHPDQSCWMIPENADAHKFTELRNYEMRVRHEWPEATLAVKTVPLKWSLRQKNGASTDIEMLEFGGEVFRAAFKDEGSSPEHKEAAEQLVSYLIDADFIVVLVSLRELFRGKDDSAVFERDAESAWVTRGLLDFVKKHLPQKVGLIIALTQADLYKAELEKYGGPEGVFKSRWPMLYSLYPELPVVAVASVSATTADGRPAEGYSTEGVLPVMKAYSEYLYGSPKELLGQLDQCADRLTNVAVARPLETLDKELRRHGERLVQLTQKVSMVDSLYDEVVEKHKVLAEVARKCLTELKEILAKPIDERQGSAIWRDLKATFPAMAVTITTYENDSREQYALALRERARKEEEAQKAHEEEMRRAVESERLDAERRRKLELTEGEQRAAAEKARIEKERSRIALRSFVVRVVIIVLVLGGVAWGVKSWRDSVARQEIARLEKARQVEQSKRDRIETENAVRLADMRKAEADKKALEEKNRAAELARQRQVEENRRKELELKLREEERKRGEEKQRLAQVVAEQARLESERKKAQEERALEEAKKKRLEEENRKRQIEIEREATARKAEAERLRKIEEKKEQERQEQARLEKERREAEEKARKDVEEKAKTFALLKTAIAAVDAESMERAEGLFKEVRAKAELLSADGRLLLERAGQTLDLMKKAESGDEKAQRELSMAFLTGTVILSKNHEKAYGLLVKLADKGDAVSQYAAGKMLLTGDGVVANPANAFKMLLGAAEQNEPRAQYEVAEMYRQGIGVNESQRNANKWYERAAGLGNVNAQITWGKRLDEGVGMFFSDHTAAFQWYSKAAGQGNGEACYRLGVMFYDGHHVKLSLYDAYRLFVAAQKAGFTNSDLERRLRVCEDSLSMRKR